MALEYLLLSEELAATVNGQRVWRVLLRVGSRACPIKDVVGAEVEKLDLIFSAEISEDAGALCVDPVGELSRILAPINVGDCGKVDKNVGLVSAKISSPSFLSRISHCSSVAGMISKCFERSGQDVCADETVTACNQYLHCRSMQT